MNKNNNGYILEHRSYAKPSIRHFTLMISLGPQHNLTRLVSFFRNFYTRACLLFSTAKLIYPMSHCYKVFYAAGF